MKTRVLIPELMDDSDLDPVEHVRALKGLQRINAWTGNALLAWRPIWKLLHEIDCRSLRVLDVATGAADIPIGLWRRAAARGIELEIDACDISDTALEFAARNCVRAKARVRLFRHDILQQGIPEKYDVVFCSQFLHHLTNEQAAEVLAKMASAAMRRVVVVDLVRSQLNWLQVWLATRMLSRSRVVHFDGPQSIRAAFTTTELRALADPCNFGSLTIRTDWPCRLTLTGALQDHD